MTTQMKWFLCRLVCLMVAALPVRAQVAPDYSGFNASLFIPFANPQSVPFHDAPELRFSVAGSEVLTRPMDTGSVGIAISYDQIPTYQTLKNSPGASSGSEFLSSSKLLWVGTWVPATVTFYDGNQELATASVPVLAVEQAGRCPAYTKTSGLNCPCTAGSNTCPCLNDPGNATCPCPAGSNTCPLPSAKGQGIAYMGVGFGQEADFQPQGTPDKNPLLNLATIARQPVVAKTFHPGYIIGSTGVTVGLTSINTSGFSFIPLQPYPQNPGDWLPATMCVQINGSPCANAQGTILVDTGIAQSYITVPSSTSFSTVQAPDPSDPARKLGVLADGTTVTVNLPGLPNPVTVYSYTVGQGMPSAPYSVIPTVNGSLQPFVNTGRHFLRQFQFLYDPCNGNPCQGYIGLKPQTGGQ